MFFHNGVFHRLEDVVRFYAERDTQPQKWYPRGPDGSTVKFDDLPAQYRANVDMQAPFGGQVGGDAALNDDDIRDIVAFLADLERRLRALAIRSLGCNARDCGMIVGIMRLKGKFGIVVGAGQTPGDTIGNGRAAAMLFAREGANVMLVDRDLERAEETAALIARCGRRRPLYRRRLDACRRLQGLRRGLHRGLGPRRFPAQQCRHRRRRWTARSDHRGCVRSDHAGQLEGLLAVLPGGRCPPCVTSGSGSIVNISSIAAVSFAPGLTAYKLSKIGMNMLGHAACA